MTRRPTRSTSSSTTYATHRELIEAIKQGDVPDVFLVDRADLAYLLDEGVSQPIGERLDERDVDFGDDYSRAALEAFSFDRDLQCMPYGISPLVVYYNTALVDFELMAERGLEVPNLDPDARLRWSSRGVPGGGGVRRAARAAARAGSTSHRPSTGCRRSSCPAGARSMTTTTSPPRWPSPPTTASRPSSGRCRSCATRGSR